VGKKITEEKVGDQKKKRRGEGVEGRSFYDRIVPEGGERWPLPKEKLGCSRVKRRGSLGGENKKIFS